MIHFVDQAGSSRKKNKLASKRVRAGALYISVLMTSLIVSVSTLAGLMLLDLRLDSVKDGGDATRARQLSDSAMALMLARLDRDKDWRSNYINGVATPRQEFDGGEFWAVLTNAQGNLLEEGDRSVELTVHSRFGDAGHALAATLDPEYSPTELLEYTVIVGGNLELEEDKSISTDGTVFVQRKITSGANSIYGELERGSSFGLLGTLLRRLFGSVQNTAIPAESEWIEEYAAIGTEIPLRAIPGRKIEEVTLSASNNPYGTETNPRGVYYIRCNGAKIEILRSRIEGTLVLFDCDSDSVIKESVHWNPSEPGLPSLIADGGFQIDIEKNPLQERQAKTNFNPPHTPYYGDSDNDETDDYPSRIRGLVVITGDAIVDGDDWTWIDGGLYVFGNLIQKTHLRTQRDDDLIFHPPPGFRTATGMQIRNGTIHSTATND